MINSYENIYILKGSLTEEQAQKEFEEIKKYFDGAGVYQKENDQNGYLGNKKLAYDIKGEKMGHFYLTHFKTTPQKVVEIEKNLRLNDNVIKFITIKVEEG